MWKRWLSSLVISVALGSVVACGDSGGAQPPVSTATSTSNGRLEAQIVTAAARVRADIGVHAVDLASGVTADVHSGNRFPILSMFKVYAAAAILRDARAGKLSLQTPVRITRADIVSNAPVTSAHVNGTLTMAEIAQAALQHSDNTAGNLMLRQLGGPAAVNALARSVGDTDTDLERWETALNDAVPGDVRDTTTPRAVATGFRSLLAGDGLQQQDRDTLVGWMRGSATSAQRFRAQLPAGWTTADKTGSGEFGTTDDGGLLLGPGGRRILLVVQTRSGTDDPNSNGYGDLVAEVARLVAQGLR
ncbi:class A beta-lactamase [Williamsia sterculiae]|uniref:Beta-lactamase class A n=1 Tax=Williamsia sterculiae TaxID=1344003 RepID=A0A1N7CSA0_9NOCA|nr:class A beta-lactamase [Williamsia sterculiae]SIR66431.1 beta-lactamase class A [Williamsia sterculiae]